MQPETEPPTDTPIDQKRGWAQRPWRTGIRAIATLFTITGIALQIGVVAPASSGDGFAEDPEFGQFVWFSPESFTFVSLPADMNLSLLGILIRRK